MNFKNGDMVRVKWQYESPHMRIKSVQTWQDYALCRWFDKINQLHEAAFRVSELEHIPTPPPMSQLLKEAKDARSNSGTLHIDLDPSTSN